MTYDPIEKCKSPQEVENLLYDEEINRLISLASRGVMWARRKVIAELGADTFDNLPEYYSCEERGSQYN